MELNLKELSDEDKAMKKLLQETNENAMKAKRKNSAWSWWSNQEVLC